MRFLPWIVSGLVGLVASGTIGACSSSPEGSPGAEPGPADATVEATAPREASAQDAELACEPTALDGPPKWTPPLPRTPDACSPAEVEGYVQSCLYDFDTPAICEAFKKQNPTCAACLDSNDGDPRWGALVFFRQRMYFDFNYGGCVAHVLGDDSEEGCGAAEGRIRECERMACRGCVNGSSKSEREALFACIRSQQMRTICAAEIAKWNVACADYVKPTPDDPLAACFTIGNETLEDQVRRYLTSWCSVPVDAGADALTDAGDDAADADGG